jgi:Zn-finger nucleic acid-binding protein
VSDDRALNCPKCGAPLDPNTDIVPGTTVHVCSGCYGSFYRKAELAVPLDLYAPKASKLTCPDCGKPMEVGTVYEGRIELDRCKACGAFWFDAGEVDALRRLAGVERIARLPGEPAPDDGAPPAAKSGPAGAPASPAKKKGPAPARSSDDEPAPQPPDMIGGSPKTKPHANAVTLDGVRFDHFQTSVPVVTAVLGEFPWIAKVGDHAQTNDYVHPPRLLSQELSGKESVWTVGDYIEPGEVWAAFNLPDSPPAQRGVSPAQPNPWKEGLGWVLGSAAIGSALCLGVFLYRTATASGATVLNTSCSFAATDPEKSRVSPLFEVTGPTSNLEVTLDTNVDNHWAYFDIALIESDTDEALDVGQEVSYYHGVEDGESWTEGASFERLYLPSVPPGHYYLRVEPDGDAYPFSLHATVRRDVPLERIPAIAIALLLLPSFLWWFMKDNFESSRWMESDHPPLTSSGDGDDD